MDEQIELGLQLPQVVDNAPVKEVVRPDDDENVVIEKCGRAISKKVQRVLFNLFENVEINVHNFKLESDDNVKEEARGLKSRLNDILTNLKTALFKAKIDIEEREGDYEVEGCIAGKNLEMVKKLRSILRIIQTIDGVKVKTAQDLNNLRIVIAKSEKIVDQYVDREDLSNGAKTKVENAQATITDRTAKLEQKEVAHTEISDFLRSFINLDTVDVDELWQGAQELIENLEKGNHLNDETQKKLDEIKQTCIELKATCNIPKGRAEEQIAPEVQIKKISTATKLVCAIMLLLGVLGIGVLSFKLRGHALEKIKNRKTLASLKAEARALKAAKRQILERTDLLTDQIINDFKNLHIKKLRKDITLEEAKRLIIRDIEKAIHAFMKLSMKTLRLSPEILSGKKPFLVFEDRYKGGVTATATFVKYKQVDTDDGNTKGLRRKAKRRYVCEIKFEGALSGVYSSSGAVDFIYFEGEFKDIE